MIIGIRKPDDLEDSYRYFITHKDFDVAWFTNLYVGISKVETFKHEVFNPLWDVHEIKTLPTVLKILKLPNGIVKGVDTLERAIKEIQETYPELFL